MTISKTAAGHQVLKDRSAGLSPRQRAALILVDGHRTFDEVLAATGTGGVTRADLDMLLAMGLVADEPGDSYPMPLLTGMGVGARERYMQAYGLATTLTSSLGRRGGALNHAVEAAGSLDELQELAPLIRAAVGPSRFAPLDKALRDA